ncbi:ABC transporter substrate-binding protein [Desulfomonile tiedjei]|uniref:ABC-type dipeptide transport system, periplasmic component n=1 Tax=Desulfomonile tiedjei (strain ATCC 49306 / DSM 6799 / DCB-1) TaxID=706587 RepID=I4CF66_DESTA|nr:ABC transporter substrate-binding protein [Desulfomonile tiedjei]AFM28207.1 ABC-type dipeptide transport system, periplasmic component [Desulfomonile tiedjei DSM 6799]
MFHTLSRALIVFIVISGIALWGSLSHAWKEAPSLAKRVETGELPPVDKRLPETPVVITPVDKPGIYGGVWRRAYTGLSDLVGTRRIIYEPLVRWSPDYKVVPNLATKWEISEDGREYVFHLVKGVRWSDGAPFTADDILFYVEDILMDKELTASIPQWLAPTGVLPTVTKIDDYTIKVVFPEPYSMFLERLACPDGMAPVTKPKHYLKKFHKKYADPAELEALVRERNSTSWVKLFQEITDMRHGIFTNKDMPSLCAWITKVPAPAKRFVMERNPYYWKVDTEGKQLPYIESIVHDLQAEAQTILLKAIAGEIDMEARHLGGMQSSVLLLANLAEGKYKLIPKISTASVGLLLAPNINHTDEAMKAILSNPKFRIALSYAINRKEINKIVYRGKGTPRQPAPLKESEYYSPSLESAYTEYDPAKAAALLNEIGIKLGPDGKRIRPDGEPMRLTLDVVVSVQSWVDQAEIVASNFKAIGIDTEVKAEARELFIQRTRNASHDIALWTGDGGIECLLDPRWYFPYSTESLNAPLYGLWFQSGGQKGEEPPAEIKNMMETYNQILRTVSEEKKKELFKSILAANEKNLWVIGLVHDPPDYYVVTKNMLNVPKKDFQSWMYPNPGPAHPEQFFYESVKK